MQTCVERQGAFVEMRRSIAANEEIIRKIKEIDQTILDHEKKFLDQDTVLRTFWEKLNPLLEATPPRKPIGFQVETAEKQ